MSAIASAFVLPRSALTRAPIERLARHAIATRDFELGSGYLVGYAVGYLNDHGIQLSSPELDQLAEELSLDEEASCCFVSETQRLADLEPARFREAELGAYLDEMTDDSNAGGGRMMLDAIGFLRDTLAMIDAASIALVVIR